MRVLVIQNRRCEHLGTLDGLFGYDVIEADEGESIPPLKKYDALIMLGGPASAYDGLRYLREEEKIIKDAIKDNIPTLGICLGAQLIAKACNARVYKNLKEIGWYKVKLHNSLARYLNTDILTVFQWHNDSFELPEGAELLASLSSIQAFRIKSAVGVQFHLELTDDMISEWIDEYDEEIIQSSDNISLKEYAKHLWSYPLTNSLAKQVS